MPAQAIGDAGVGTRTMACMCARSGALAAMNFCHSGSWPSLAREVMRSLRSPEAHPSHVLLARRHHRLEEVQPLTGPADLGAIPAQLVDVPGVLGRLERQGRREDLRLLGQEERPDLRDIALGPLVVPGELGPQ